MFQSVAAHSMAESLSPRERQVFHLVGQAKANKEIGRDLLMSPRTVEIHIANVKRKLNCRNKMAMALLAHGIEV